MCSAHTLSRYKIWLFFYLIIMFNIALLDLVVLLFDCYVPYHSVHGFFFFLLLFNNLFMIPLSCIEDIYMW